MYRNNYEPVLKNLYIKVTLPPVICINIFGNLSNLLTLPLPTLTIKSSKGW